MKLRAVTCILLAVSLVFSAAGLHAQLTTATIVGAVTDLTGAAIPGASIQATNVDTQFSRTVTSGAQGEYRLDYLPVGTYEVKVQAPGFTSVEQKPITLTLNAEVHFNATLKPGGSTETVTVTEGAPLIQTTISSIGRTIENQEVDNLPIVNRNAYDLLTLTPGVQTSSNVNTLGYPQQVVYINGGTDNFVGSVSYYLDGGLNMTFIRNTGNILPNPDALREFAVQTNNYNALYGRMSSGLVNVVTKSGTNQMHGSVFEFFRSDKLNATPAFSISGKSPLHRNQFGATLGGPIIHDRAFFFGSYGGLRQTTSAFLNTAIVPTAAQRTGDFSAFLPTSSGTITSCSQKLSTADKAAGNYIVCNPTTRKPYQNNIIPGTALDPTAQAILKQNIPLANNGNLWQGYSPSPLNTDEFLIKADHNLTSTHRLEAMYFNTSGNQSQIPGSTTNSANQIQVPTGALPWSTQNFTWRQQNANLSDTWTISSNKINQIWLNYTRMLSARINTPETSLHDYGSSFMQQGAAMLPQISVSGYFTLSQAISGPKTGTNFYSIRDVFSLNKGKHAFSVGAEASLNKDVQYTYLNNYGVFSFSASTSARTGNALADFITGLPNTMNQDSPIDAIDNSFFYGIFAQDDYRITPNLTLNLGLRWDIQTPPVDPKNREATFVEGQQSTVYPTAPAGLLIVGDKGVERGVVTVRWHHVSPRVGFAWDPYGNGRTAVRGAFGLFFGSVSGNEWNGISNFQPFAVRNKYSFIKSLTDVYGDSRSFPNGNPYPYVYNPASPQPFITPATLEGMDKDYQWPYTYQANFSVQQQFSNDFAATFSYIGSFSHDVPFAPDINYPMWNSSATTNNYDSRRPILPGTLSTVSLIQSHQSAHYHALQVDFEKRMSHTLSLKGFYTFSKTLTSASVQNSGAVLGSAEDFNRMDLEYGSGDNDVRHRSTTAIVWKPDYFDHSNVFTRAVLNGWTLSAILSFQSGSPFTLTTGSDNNNDGNNNDRVNPTGEQYSSGAGNHRSLQAAAYFNTNAFCSYTYGSTTCPAGVGPGGVDGTTRRNGYWGPGSKNVNASLFRDFKVWEGITLQGRAEVTNLFNFVNLSNPSTTYSSANFGKITSAGAMRQIQIGARILF